MNPTAIVVGSGRCGTSTIGRILHENLNICMGHHLKVGDELNPKGYYEDLVCHAMVRVMCGRDKGPYTPNIFLGVMNNLHKNCLAWGFKDPWALYLPKEILKAIKPKVCVVTTRDLQGTVESWFKVYQKANPHAPITKEVAAHYEQLTLEREELAKNIITVWPNVVQIDVSKHVSDEDITTKLRNGLTAANFIK